MALFAFCDQNSSLAHSSRLLILNHFGVMKRSIQRSRRVVMEGGRAWKASWPRLAATLEWGRLDVGLGDVGGEFWVASVKWRIATTS